MLEKIVGWLTFVGSLVTAILDRFNLWAIECMQLITAVGIIAGAVTLAWLRWSDIKLRREEARQQKRRKTDGTSG